MQISELKLAKDLIRKPSITPKDAGAINLLAKNLRSLGGYPLLHWTIRLHLI